MDKKYESLKVHYYNLSKSIKFCKDKCRKLKMENVELSKKLMSFEMRDRKFMTRSTAGTSSGRINLSSVHKMFNDLRTPNFSTVKSRKSCGKIDVCYLTVHNDEP